MNTRGTTKIKTIIVALVLGIFVYAPAEAKETTIQAALETLKKDSMQGYALNKLGEIERNLSTFSNKLITTTNEEESLHELIRVLSTSKKTYDAVNNYVVFGWNKTLEYLYWANVAAVKRGIIVTRTFIIGDDILQDHKMLDALFTIMETQSRDGIKVFYGLQRELAGDPVYTQYALMDAGLSDDEVFAQVTAVSVKGPQPAYVNIIWDTELIKKKNPFPYLKASPHIRPFDEHTKKRLLEIAGKKNSSE